VPFGPHADLIAPLVGGQRHAAAIEDAAVRFVLGSFAVDDDAVEVENDGFQQGHHDIIVLEF
jgi:hypothetical protein